LRNLDEMEAHPIQGTDERPENPFFSPDGDWVGYFSRTDAQLKKIAPIGGASVTLCDATRLFGASWGSDNTILYGQPEGIMRVSANGGTPELVIPTEAPEQIHGPQMLPGGEWVLFTLTSVGGPTRWDEAQIVVQSLESGERKILWEGGSDARYVPTGHLVYALEYVLFALPFDLTSLEVSGGPVPIVEGVRRAGNPTTSSASANYGLSAGGTLVYVPGSTVGSSRSILALADRSGVVDPLDMPPNNYLYPRLSPDGNRLVVQTTDNDGSDLWVYDLSGENQIRQLTFGGNNTNPIWTPDGQRVTFSSSRDGKPSIYWKPADGSGVAERLTTPEEGTRQFTGSWSPDGKTLALVVRLPARIGIWTLSHDGETTTPEVFADESGQLGPVFSPDGRWLAYMSRESDTPQVYVQPFPKTGAIHRVTQQGGRHPLWSPDGTELFYLNGSLLMGIDIATEPAFSFGTEQAFGMRGFLDPNSPTRPYDITPDGQRFLMVFPADQADLVAETPDDQINIVLNWFEELKERVPVP
jgi:serine/threonine-protein kinase